jgi:hypothetical protein
LRRGAVPVALNDLILKLLAKRPEDRPASSREVHAALYGMLRGGLTAAQDELRKVLSVRQEATAVMMGLLP